MKIRKTMDFAKAVRFVSQKPQILLGWSQKKAKKPKTPGKAWEAPDTLKDFLWYLGFFAFFFDLPSKM